MAGTVKKLQFSEGTDVGAPSDLGILSSTTAMSVYANDAAFVTANGTAQEGDMYINSTDRTIHAYIGAAWRSIPPKNDFTDSTKIFVADVAGNTTAVTSTLDFNDTVNSTHTVPAGTNTLATDATATSTVKGLVTSFYPLVVSSVHTVSSADYPILDNDGYYLILVTTGASNRTITLPAVANNKGRKIKIIKADTGAGFVIVSGTGFTTRTIYSQNNSVEVISDVAAWWLLDHKDVKYQRKFLSSNITGNGGSQTALTFNNLIIGRTYKVHGRASVNQNSTGNNYNVELHDGSNTIQGGSSSIINPGVTGTQSHQFTEIFVAATTTLNLRVGGLDSPSIIIGSPSGGDNATAMTLEELQSHFTTTDWT